MSVRRCRQKSDAFCIFCIFCTFLNRCIVVRLSKGPFIQFSTRPWYQVSTSLLVYACHSLTDSLTMIGPGSDKNGHFWVFSLWSVRDAKLSTCWIFLWWIFLQKTPHTWVFNRHVFGNSTHGIFTYSQFRICILEGSHGLLCMRYSSPKSTDASGHEDIVRILSDIVICISVCICTMWINPSRWY